PDTTTASRTDCNTGNLALRVRELRSRNVTRKNLNVLLNIFTPPLCRKVISITRESFSFFEFGCFFALVQRNACVFALFPLAVRGKRKDQLFELSALWNAEDDREGYRLAR